MERGALNRTRALAQAWRRIVHRVSVAPVRGAKRRLP
jgi:hypothetical protein